MIVFPKSQSCGIDEIVKSYIISQMKKEKLVQKMAQSIIIYVEIKDVST